VNRLIDIDWNPYTYDILKWLGGRAPPGKPLKESHKKGIYGGKKNSDSLA
jgi:hypothetical protein